MTFMSKPIDDQQISEILAPVSQEKSRANEAKVRAKFWPKFRAFAAKIPFAEDVAATYYCAIDTNTPVQVRATLFAALAYFILPIDLIPDILALVGMGDDMAVLTVAISMVSGHVTDEHRQKARDAMSAEEAVEEPPAS